jgi:hypothetical protein
MKMENRNFRLITPKDFFKEKVIDTSKIKSKIISSEVLSNYFIFIELNKPTTRTQLTRDIEARGINSYTIKTIRILDKLQSMGLIECKMVKEIDRENPSEIDKMILSKYECFLKNTTNPFNKKYDEMYFYYLSDLGYEILPTIAKKLNCGIAKF